VTLETITVTLKHSLEIGQVLRSNAVPEVDAEKIILAQKGEAQAFAELVESHQVAVYNLCYRMLGDPYEAEDAAQETFIRAYKGIKSFDRNRSFSTWILSIAAHYCIDQLRKKRLNITHLEERPYLEIPDPGLGPEATLSETEQQKGIRKLLNVLSEVDRAAVIMFYWYEFSYDEIAKALDLSVSAVKSRLHRARILLAKTWKDQKQTTSGLERQIYGSPAV
jgi:RNA polymerase sigma-70 factor (ECF subfamily)